jgi:hypothetical protein
VQKAKINGLIRRGSFLEKCSERHQGHDSFYFTIDLGFEIHVIAKYNINCLTGAYVGELAKVCIVHSLILFTKLVLD